MSMVKSGKGLFRYGRGSQKFAQSWDRQKMEERERARERARAAKLAVQSSLGRNPRDRYLQARQGRR